MRGLRHSGRGIRPTGAVGLYKVGVYAGLLLVLYWSAFRWLVLADWARGDYSYGYMMPLIVLYLIWEKRAALSREPSRPSWAGMAPLVAGILLFWLGELAGEYFTLYMSFWFVLVGLCWSHLGWGKTRTIGFPLLMVLTMFPLPNFLHQKVSFSLKLFSSQIGVAMMRLAGMSAYREGNVIDLGFTQLQVVDACSGLRYLMPLLVLGLLLAHFYRGALWKKAAIVLSSIVLSVVTNSLRIAFTGLLQEVWGVRVAEGFFHGFSGWFIFMFSFAALLALMWALSRIGPRREALRAGQSPNGQKDLGLGEDGGGPLAFSLARPPQFLVAVALLGATAALSRGVEFRERIPIARPLAEFPLELGPWVGTRETMEQQFLEALDLSDYVIVDYRDGAGKSVNLYVAYYETQRKGESIHSPETCLPGSGWTFAEAGEVALSVPGYEEGGFRVRRALMEKLGERELAYFWFAQRGRVLTSAYELKLWVFWDALTKHRTDGALVRIITPAYEGERLEDAEARLEEFARQVVPVLEGFVPGREISGS